jgi:hypothetical protein
LDGGSSGVEVRVKENPDQDLWGGGGHRNPADQAVLLLGTEHDHQQSGDRYEGNYGQQMVHFRRFYITSSICRLQTLNMVRTSRMSITAARIAYR